MKKVAKGRRGPKGDPGKARAAILAAARAEFGRRGFEAATLRAIAEAAGVDVALVSYYFGSKADLFLEALELPVDPAAVLGGVLEQGLDGAGERLLRALLTIWDEPGTGAPLAAMMRSLATRADVLRLFVESKLVGTIAAALTGPDAELRAAAFTTQVFGLLLERYVLEIEPLASAGHDELVALIAPNLQRYLDG